MLDFKTQKFTNGLTLVTAPLQNTKAMTVIFLVGTGSRYETKNINGMSHFLEHMFFKGTKKRPTTLDIAKSLDAVGAGYNAFTSEEHTGFFVRAASEHFDLALDVLFDMLYNATFSEAEIEREKGVISEEINMYQDTPQSYINDVAKKLLYGNQPLGWQITGEQATIQKFQKSDFITYRDRYYTPDNMIVAVAGGQNNFDWKAKIESYFEKVTTQRKGEYLKVKEAQTKPGLSIYHKKTDQAHLIMGFRTLKRTDERRPILKVMSALLGDYMSSRLFTEVRERRGLAYYVSSEIAEFQDTGAFGASAGVDIRRAEEAVKVILEEFNKLKTDLVSETELKRAKENLKGRLYLNLEESASVADFLAEQQLFWGKIETPEALVAKYQKVTAGEIQNLAKMFFRKENLNLALIGPFKENQKFYKILERFS